MKKKILLFILFSACIELHAQTGDMLYVKYQLAGAKETANWYYLAGPGSFSVISLATNFCARSNVKWTVHPKKGASISNPNGYEPTVSFTLPGTYSLTMTVNTFSEPGWSCATASKYAIKYISIPYPKKKK